MQHAVISTNGFKVLLATALFVIMSLVMFGTSASAASTVLVDIEVVPAPFAVDHESITLINNSGQEVVLGDVLATEISGTSEADLFTYDSGLLLADGDSYKICSNTLEASCDAFWGSEKLNNTGDTVTFYPNAPATSGNEIGAVSWESNPGQDIVLFGQVELVTTEPVGNGSTVGATVYTDGYSYENRTDYRPQQRMEFRLYTNDFVELVDQRLTNNLGHAKFRDLTAGDYQVCLITDGYNIQVLAPQTESDGVEGYANRDLIENQSLGRLGESNICYAVSVDGSFQNYAGHVYVIDETLDS